MLSANRPSWIKRLLPAGLIGLISLSAHAAENPPHPGAAGGVIDIVPLTSFAQALDLLKEKQLSQPSDKQLFDAALLGMVRGIDASGSVLTVEEYEDLLSFTEGQLSDSGLELTYRDGSRRISNIKAGSSASQSELQVGDEVLVIDRQRISDLNSTDQKKVDALLIDEVGSVLSIESKRGRKVTQTVLVRDAQPKQQLRLVIDQGTLFLKIERFTEETPLEIARAIEIYQPQRVIIDVSDNLGGVLQSALQSANLFVQNVPLIQIESPNQALQTKTADQAATFLKLPLSIWVNRKTASAAEVFAVALQSAKRAAVLGEQTYGKGTVQQVFPLPDGRAIKFTVARYLSAKGEPIDQVGVTPNRALDAQTREHFARLLKEAAPTINAVTNPSPGPAGQTEQQLHSE